jgi:hypothetical protein
MIRALSAVSVAIGVFLISVCGAHAPEGAARHAFVTVTVGGAAVLAQSAPPPGASGPKPRPKMKGRMLKLHVDSSPQQAAVYWDAGATPAPRDYGIVGYTPIDLKVPKGAVKIIVELRGWRTQERDLDMRKAQSMTLTMERAPLPGKLDLRAGGDGSAAGAEVAIDGVVRGTVPNVFELVAGHHQVEVRKTGYKPFSEWVDLTEDERRTRDLSLVQAEQPGGSLLVTSDGGGDVYIDGVRRDVAPAMIGSISAGDHIVEVRKDGVAPWRQTVTVVSGQQSKVAANLVSAAASIGAVRVISNEGDVEVFFDGEDKGRAPIDLKDVKPGQHIIEGRKAKFRSQEQSVRVGGGEQALVELKLEAIPEDRPKAQLRVQSAVPDAEVFLDGASLGKAPIERKDLEPGKHYITVRKDGYAEFKREVVLVENAPLSFAADLRASGNLKFLSTPRGATVSIDGEPIGATPATRPDISAGEHIIEFRMAGYFDSKQTIKVEGGKERIVAADLRVLPTGPTPEQKAKQLGGMSSWGAKAHPVGGFTADVGAGYPYIFMARLTVGMLQMRNNMAIDGGIEARTYFQDNDLAIHARMQLLQAGPLTFGVRGDLGGGIGPGGRGTFFGDASGIMSLSFNDIVTVSGSFTFNAYSDRFCPTLGEVAKGLATLDSRCTDAAALNPAIWPKDPRENRFSGHREYVGLSVDASINRQFSAFVSFLFMPFADTFGLEPRLAFLDKYNSVMFQNDPYFYGNAGVTMKF